MPDYSNGKIYTIRCRTDDTLVYVGSTIQPLAVRWGGHKKDSKTERKKNMLIYRTINNDWENWYIELHSLYPCDSKEELCRREGEVIREMGTLNTNIAGRTKKEYDKNWYENNKDKKKEYHKNWHENNKEKQNEQSKIWYENNKNILKEQIPCECGCMISRGKLKRHLKSKKHIEQTNKLIPYF